MHELSLARSLVEELEELARLHRVGRIVRVLLEVGALACVEPEALDWAFQEASRGSTAEGARLDLTLRPGRARCLGCREEREAERWGQPCPSCGAPTAPASGSASLVIRELEWEG